MVFTFDQKIFELIYLSLISKLSAYSQPMRHQKHELHFRLVECTSLKGFIFVH